MFMKQQGHRWLNRRRCVDPRLRSWCGILLFVSSSSLTLSQSASFRSISSFAVPIVAQAAFYSPPQQQHANRNRRRFTATSMTLIPATPISVARSSTAADPFLPSGDLCLRRSSRIGNKNQVAGTNQRKGVRLFQDGPSNNENEKEGEGSSNKEPTLIGVVPTDASIENDEGSSIPSPVASNKRVTRSLSKGGSDDSVGRTTKRHRSGVAASASPSTRGTNAVAVTPEVVESTDSAATTTTRAKKKTTKARTNKATLKEKTEKKKSTRKTKAKTKTKSPVKTKKRASKVLVSWPEPDGWRDTYELVRDLRKDKSAPCDQMGAEALVVPPPDRIDNVNDEDFVKTSRFQTLIALMLSSQTKDAMVGQAMGNLRDTSDGSDGLTVASILDMDPKVLNKKIYSVGFRNNKTKYIKEAAQILHDQYNDDVPPTAAEMIRDLPGVGPKMAYIIENICWDKQTGIGVDTHMQRLFPKLEWVSPDTKNPEQTRKQLESWLPQELWGEVNLLWVGFGQEVQQEKPKILRKALRCDRPIEAIRLLRSVDFDVVGEWKKMQSVASSTPDTEKTHDLPWADDIERGEIDELIKEAMSQKRKR